MSCDYGLLSAKENFWDIISHNWSIMNTLLINSGINFDTILLFMVIIENIFFNEMTIALSKN